MTPIPTLRQLFAATAFLMLSTAAHAQYPEKPIRLVVPFPPGGIADTVSRAVGEHLGKRLGQPIAIENRPGGRQMIGAQAVARAAPDGYTLLLGGITPMSLNPASGIAMPYDVQRDFAPVSRLFHGPLFLVTAADVPAKTVKDLIAHVKANPGKVSYASVGPGSSNHIAGELFNQQAGVNMLHVPHKGSAPALTDLLGGRVQVMFDGGPSSLPHVAAGKLNLLAVTSAQRFSGLPTVPTMAESGLPGFDVTPWWGILAPAGTPAAVVERLNKELQAVVGESPELRERFVKVGVELQTSTPQEFASFIEAETKRWSIFIKTSGIDLTN